jgi:hypothetical protein
LGVRLSDADELVHSVGEAGNWNESRYFDFYDSAQGIAGWFRIGFRPNEGRAEVSAAVNLPDGTTAFSFERAPISGNGLSAGGQVWEISQPWETTRVRQSGTMILLADPWTLTDPKAAFRASEQVEAEIDLTVHGSGVASVMGQDQDQIDLIFLPGQADFHYQHLVRTEGTLRIGDREWQVAGRGGRDHSWGPRNWHAKLYFRWLICSVDDDFGFMIVRGVGPAKQTRSGFVWDAGEFLIVDGFELRNEYAGAPHFEVRSADVSIRAGSRHWSARATPQGWLPLRHRQSDERGLEAVLRIVKSPSSWDVDGTAGVGMLEYHDLIEDGRPVGLAE